MLVKKPVLCLFCMALAPILNAQDGNRMVDMNPAAMFLMDNMSGTAVNPAASAMPMIMKPLGNWNTMFMAEAFITETQQSGPRGAGKLYSPNWLMADAEHKAGENGAFEFQVMLSLEPATVTERRYPLLFQTGETAYGRPIVDGQHPHNFVMALGVQYALSIGANTTLQLYFAPVGDPALGPVAYPHRASAAEIPQATISHHWEDSTHISDDVVTAGVAYKKVKLEASGFYGSEPGENRWIIQQGPINSWSTRLWYFPNEHWAAQVSAGHLAHPEALEAGDQNRITASVAYTKSVRGRDWSSTAIWGRLHNTQTKRNLNAYTLESILPVGSKGLITGRMDLVDKDDLQIPLQDGTYRIGGFTIGYTHNVHTSSYLESGIGANVELYSLPETIKPFYGNRPLGGNVFIRLRLKPRA